MKLKMLIKIAIAIFLAMSLETLVLATPMRIQDSTRLNQSTPDECRYPPCQGQR